MKANNSGDSFLPLDPVKPETIPNAGNIRFVFSTQKMVFALLLIASGGYIMGTFGLLASRNETWRKAFMFITLVKKSNVRNIKYF